MQNTKCKMQMKMMRCEKNRSELLSKWITKKTKCLSSTNNRLVNLYVTNARCNGGLLYRLVWRDSPGRTRRIFLLKNFWSQILESKIWISKSANRSGSKRFSWTIRIIIPVVVLPTCWKSQLGMPLRVSCDRPPYQTFNLPAIILLVSRQQSTARSSNLESFRIEN